MEGRRSTARRSNPNICLAAAEAFSAERKHRPTLCEAANQWFLCLRTHGTLNSSLISTYWKETKEWRPTANVELHFLLSISFTEDSAMASREQQEREEAFLIDQDPFRRNAYNLIVEMAQLIDEAGGGTKHLLDEMLHSIFFLGKVSEPTFSPESILLDEEEEVLTVLRELFPRAFELFSSHLPRRSPFSCVLDMIVLLNGREGEILSGLRELIIGLELGNSRELISSTLCVSHRTDIDDPDKYYGVSMAAPSFNPQPEVLLRRGPFPRRFVIAASCLYYWDEYIAGAVLTYYPTRQIRPDYDGTIQLPQWVRCQAFSLRQEEETPPCRSCSNLFGLWTNSNDEWVYGNCGEVESLSNLFKTEDEVKQRARPTSPLYSDEMRDHYKREMCRDLINCLREKNFTWREGDFYIPS